MRTFPVYFAISLFMMSGALGAATVDCATVAATPSMLCHSAQSATEPDNMSTCTKQCTIKMAPQISTSSNGNDVISAGVLGSYNNSCPPSYSLIGVKFASGYNTGNYHPSSQADMAQKISDGWACGPTAGGNASISGLSTTRTNQSGPALPGSYLEFNGMWFVESAQFDGKAHCLTPVSNCYDTSVLICKPDGTAVEGAILKHAGECTPADGWSKSCSCTPPSQTVKVTPVACTPPGVPADQASGVPELISVCGYSEATQTPVYQ
jgi:hypothetical protein